MSRAAAAGLALLLAACGPAPEVARDEAPDDAPRPKHVILLSLDTLRADHLGAWGYERATSPRLDALAARSIVFEQALAQASSTYPSHASLFQSRLASHADDAQPALAEVLRAAGWRTAAFTGGGNVSAQLGFGRGFDRYDETPDDVAAWWDDMEAWLRAAGDEPFFLFLHTYDVHLPYGPEPPWDTRWEADYAGRLHGRNHAHHLRAEAGIPVPETYVPYALDAADRDKIVALYDGEVAALDADVGRLLDLLAELGLREDTLLVVLADHGEEFWDHGGVLHGFTVHREMLHVPLILDVPGGRFAPRRVATPVALVDVAPTILELLGLEPPPSFAGRSLMPLVAGERREEPPIVSETAGWAAIQLGRWKLIRSGRAVRGPGDLQLYDVELDPTERRDLAAEQPELVERLSARLDAELARVPARAVRVDGTELADDALLEQLEGLGYVGGR